MNFDNFKKIMQDKKKVVMVSVAILLLLLAVVGTTYAYFTATVIGNKDDNNVVITNGVMALEYIDGNQVALTNAVPGDKVTKTFKVKNTGNVTTTYTIYMSELVNDFADKTDLVYTLTGTNGGKNVSETQVPDSSSAIASDVSIDAGVTQEYTLVITFKETNDVQDDNQGKKFSTKIQINRKKDITGQQLLSTTITSLSEENPSSFITDDPASNIRYASLNENNYVYFNCSDYYNQNDDTCEKWKIVGLFKDVTKSDGSSEPLVKIVRSNPFSNGDEYGDYNYQNVIAWDLKSSQVYDEKKYSGNWEHNGYMSNNWVHATLNDALNNNYYNGEQEVSSSYVDDVMIKGSEAIKNDTTRSAIENVVWNLGGTTSDQTSDYKNVYDDERGTNTYLNHESTWTGKVGLVYLSDYLANNTLVENGSWTLTTTSNENHVFYATSSYTDCFDEEDYSSCDGNGSGIPYLNKVTPALYLNSDIKVVSGDGSSTNPYKLNLNGMLNNYI